MHENDITKRTETIKHLSVKLRTIIGLIDQLEETDIMEVVNFYCQFCGKKVMSNRCIHNESEI